MLKWKGRYRFGKHCVDPSKLWRAELCLSLMASIPTHSNKSPPSATGACPSHLAPQCDGQFDTREDDRRSHPLV